MNLSPDSLAKLAKTNPAEAKKLQDLFEKAEIILQDIQNQEQNSSPSEKDLQAICQDFGTEPPIDSQPDPARVKAFQNFIKSVRHQAKKFLQNTLPEDPKYHNLRLHQEVVRRNFKLDDFLERPSRIDGPFMAAFNEFKNTFTSTFINECATQRPAVISFLKQRKSFEQKLQALQVLDQIPALGEPIAITILGTFSKAMKNVTICDKKPGDSECRREVEKNAGCHHFHLSCNFEPTISSFENSLQIALDSKIDQVKSAGIEKLLDESKGTDLHKLIDLLHLDQMDRLISLLSTKQGPKIALQIQNLLQ